MGHFILADGTDQCIKRWLWRELKFCEKKFFMMIKMLDIGISVEDYKLWVCELERNAIDKGMNYQFEFTALNLIDELTVSFAHL